MQWAELVLEMVTLKTATAECTGPRDRSRSLANAERNGARRERTLRFFTIRSCPVLLFLFFRTFAPIRTANFAATAKLLNELSEECNAYTSKDAQNQFSSHREFVARTNGGRGTWNSCDGDEGRRTEKPSTRLLRKYDNPKNMQIIFSWIETTKTRMKHCRLLSSISNRTNQIRRRHPRRYSSSPLTRQTYNHTM